MQKKRVKKDKIKVNLEKIMPKTELETELEIIQPKEELKKHISKIMTVENNAVIISIAGYAKRVYFDFNFKDLEYYREHKNAYINKMLTIWYIGDITNAFTVKILPIKDLTDIGTLNNSI